MKKLFIFFSLTAGLLTGSYKCHASEEWQNPDEWNKSNAQKLQNQQIVYNNYSINHQKALRDEEIALKKSSKEKEEADIKAFKNSQKQSMKISQFQDEINLTEVKILSLKDERSKTGNSSNVIDLQIEEAEKNLEELQKKLEAVRKKPVSSKSFEQFDKSSYSSETGLPSDPEKESEQKAIYKSYKTSRGNTPVKGNTPVTSPKPVLKLLHPLSSSQKERKKASSQKKEYSLNFDKWNDTSLDSTDDSESMQEAILASYESSPVTPVKQLNPKGTDVIPFAGFTADTDTSGDPKEKLSVSNRYSLKSTNTGKKNSLEISPQSPGLNESSLTQNKTLPDSIPLTMPGFQVIIEHSQDADSISSPLAASSSLKKSSRDTLHSPHRKKPMVIFNGEVLKKSSPEIKFSPIPSPDRSPRSPASSDTVHATASTSSSGSWNSDSSVHANPERQDTSGIFASGSGLSEHDFYKISAESIIQEEKQVIAPSVSSQPFPAAHNPSVNINLIKTFKIHPQEIRQKPIFVNETDNPVFLHLQVLKKNNHELELSQAQIRLTMGKSPPAIDLVQLEGKWRYFILDDSSKILEVEGDDILHICMPITFGLNDMDNMAKNLSVLKALFPDMPDQDVKKVYKKIVGFRIDQSSY